VIRTDDGATLLWHLIGFGWPEEGRVVAVVRHVTDDERYAYLNQTLCAVNGTSARDEEGTKVTLDVAELVWEPVGEEPRDTIDRE